MISEKDVEYIRQLISQWYKGEVSPQNDREIYGFFQTADPSELPEDLRTEADIFLALSASADKFTDESLLKEIENAVAKEKMKERVDRLNKYAFRTILGIASAAMLIFFIKSFIPTVRNDEAPLPKLAKMEDEKQVSHDTIVVNKQAIEIKSPEALASVSTTIKADEPTRKVREITDVNEAVELLRWINSNINNQLNVGDDAIESAESGLRSIKDISEKVGSLLII